MHIVINSLRKYDIPKEDYIERNSDRLAGYKHHLTNNYLRYLQKSLMDICHRENLHQVDLLSPSENKIKNREYYASQYGQEKLDKLNEQILADGLTPVSYTHLDFYRSTRRQSFPSTDAFPSFAQTFFFLCFAVPF